MARSHYVKKARNDIYSNGVAVIRTHKKGKRIGQDYNSRDKSKPDPKGDTLIVAKGESYYWWQFAFSGRQFSKTAPKRSQLTRSNFLSQLYGIQDELTPSDYEDSASPEVNFESLSDFRDGVLDSVQQLRDECQDSLDNMPEHFQDSSDAGILLTERVENCDNWISDLENFDSEFEEPSLEDELDEEQIAEMSEEDIEEWKHKKYEEQHEEKQTELIDIVSAGYQGE